MQYETTEDNCGKIIKSELNKKVDLETMCVNSPKETNSAKLNVEENAEPQHKRIKFKMEDSKEKGADECEMFNFYEKGKVDKIVEKT